jgi:hypothetical protein
MDDIREDIAFWGCLISANVWQAADEIWGAIWLIFALAILIIQKLRRRAKANA